MPHPVVDLFVVSGIGCVAAFIKLQNTAIILLDAKELAEKSSSGPALKKGVTRFS